MSCTYLQVENTAKPYKKVLKILMTVSAIVCREIDSTEDTLKLQNDIDQLGKWARKLGMRFQPVKCNIIQLTRKWIKKINAVYS